jgi:hypothetical protein
MVDWVMISSLATAGGTLVLAGAPFASVRSANRAARVAAQSLLIGLRPLLGPTRPDDPAQQVLWGDGFRVTLGPGQAEASEGDGGLYFAFTLRNVGSGLAVLHLARMWARARRCAARFRPRSGPRFASASHSGPTPPIPFVPTRPERLMASTERHQACVRSAGRVCHRTRAVSAPGFHI